MGSSARFLNSSEAASRLGVSVKALRIYEQRGLIAPIRTEAGWRAYGPGEIARAAEVFRLYREVALANRQRRDAGKAQWQGLAFRMDAAAYGA